MSPKNIIFWRNLVGIAIVLLLQHPRLYSSGEKFLGLWLGNLVIALGGAGIVASLGLLFITKTLRGKEWLVFVVFAWVFSLLLIFSQWSLPYIMEQIATKEKSDFTGKVENKIEPSTSKGGFDTTENKLTPPAKRESFDDLIKSAQKEMLTSRNPASFPLSTR